MAFCASPCSLALAVYIGTWKEERNVKRREQERASRKRRSLYRHLDTEVMVDKIYGAVATVSFTRSFSEEMFYE